MQIIESQGWINSPDWLDSTDWFNSQDWFDWSLDLFESLKCFPSYFRTQDFWSTAGLSVRIYVEVVRYVKLSCWSKFLWPTLWSDSLFAPTQIYVEIVLYIKSFYRHLGIYFLFVPALIVLGHKIQMGFPFRDSPLLPLVHQNYFCCGSYWDFPAVASELIPFGACSDRFCYSRSLEIPSWGFLLVFPRWGLP